VGAPVIIHPGRDREAPFEIMRLFQEAGGIAAKTIMSHLDRTLLKDGDILEFADQFGCYCEYDLFGLKSHCIRWPLVICPLMLRGSAGSNF